MSLSRTFARTRRWRRTAALPRPTRRNHRLSTSSGVRHFTDRVPSHQIRGALRDAARRRFVARKRTPSLAFRDSKTRGSGAPFAPIASRGARPRSRDMVAADLAGDHAMPWESRAPTARYVGKPALHPTPLQNLADVWQRAAIGRSRAAGLSAPACSSTSAGPRSRSSLCASRSRDAATGAA